MRQKFQFIIRPAIFLILFCFIFFVMTTVLYPKWGLQEDATARTATFYSQPKDSIDVLFLGSSSFRSGISPLTLWEDFGITSYVRATSLQPAIITYYYLVESLKYQHPKIVVLDGITVFGYNNVDQNEARLRQSIDPLNLSIEKLQLVSDILASSKTQTLTSYIFPLYRYHSRWKEITKADLDSSKLKRYDYFRGEYVNYKIQTLKIPPNFMQPSNSITKYADKSLSYYQKIIELCKEKNIQVVFLTLPRLIWNQSEYLGIKRLSDMYNLPYIDYTPPQKDNEFAFDVSTDFSDVSHLNIYGAQKFTKQFGTYLLEKYDFSDKRNNPDYKQWNIDLQYFLQQLSSHK